jgi:hypothetical protein
MRKQITEKPKRPLQEYVASLLGATGLLLLICGVPAEIGFAALLCYLSHWELQMALAVGVRMITPTVIIGFVCYSLCVYITKRSRRASKPSGI